MFSLTIGFKQVDALSPLIFYFTLVYAIRRIQVNEDGLKWKGSHQVLVYVCVYNTGESYILQQTVGLLAASREIGLEVKC
jgi:hypothetical protein